MENEISPSDGELCINTWLNSIYIWPQGSAFEWKFYTPQITQMQDSGVNIFPAYIDCWDGLQFSK